MDRKQTDKIYEQYTKYNDDIILMDKNRFWQAVNKILLTEARVKVNVEVEVSKLLPEENPLESLRSTIAFDSKDYSLNKRDAWIYGIVFGWEESLDELCEKFNWDVETRARLQRLQKKFEKLSPIEVEVK